MCVVRPTNVRHTRDLQPNLFSLLRAQWRRRDVRSTLGCRKYRYVVGSWLFQDNPAPNYPSRNCRVRDPETAAVMTTSDLSWGSPGFSPELYAGANHMAPSTEHGGRGYRKGGRSAATAVSVGVPCSGACEDSEHRSRGHLGNQQCRSWWGWHSK